jgi:enamine deaminase RidA (YjgF/YER057c/UK114 family)
MARPLLPCYHRAARRNATGGAHDDQTPRAREALFESGRSQRLALCGTDKTKVVSATIWVSDIRHRETMNEAWNAWTGGHNLPGRACIEAKLADPRLLVEIAVVAAK